MTQTAPDVELMHRPLDQMLDLYVRDGLVYYRALKTERARLDRYIASLNVSPETYCRMDARAADGVLGQRLQRLRVADGDRQLSDSRAQRRVSGVRASGRSRALSNEPNTGRRGGASRSTKSRRRSCRSSRSRASISRSAAAPSGAGGCAARRSPASGCRRSSTPSRRTS